MELDFVYEHYIILNGHCFCTGTICNLVKYSFTDVTGNCGNSTCLNFNSNPIGWKSDGIGRMLVFMIVQSVFYFTILFLVESEIAHTLYHFVIKRSQAHTVVVPPGLVQEDDDVAKERSRLANNLGAIINSDKLVLSELTKFYGSNLAVNGISLGIPKGECFGLLGVNGAGKTSTFKMLTGDESVSAGNAFLNGFSVSSQIAEVGTECCV